MPYKDRETQLKAQHLHYINNKESYTSRNNRRRSLRKRWMEELLNSLHCLNCGEESPECLDFHHTNPEEKKEDVSSLVNMFRSMERICTEIEKCIVLCANCHRKHHKGTLSVDHLPHAVIPVSLRNPERFRL